MSPETTLKRITVVTRLTLELYVFHMRVDVSMIVAFVRKCLTAEIPLKTKYLLMYYPSVLR